MRQYISQEDMEATLKLLDAKMDMEAHEEEVARIKRVKGTSTPLGYRTEDERHVLWSGDSDTTTFRNTHRCWPFSVPRDS